jgi:hypothetical protein
VGGFRARLIDDDLDSAFEKVSRGSEADRPGANDGNGQGGQVGANGWRVECRQGQVLFPSIVVDI